MVTNYFLKLISTFCLLVQLTNVFCQDSINYKNEIINRVDLHQRKQGVWKLYDQQDGHYLEMNYINDSLIGSIEIKNQHSVIYKIAEPYRKPNEFVFFHKGKKINGYYMFKDKKRIAMHIEDSVPLPQKIANQVSNYSMIRAMFYGGEKMLNKFLRKNVRSPKITKKPQEVLVRYVIDRNGYVRDAIIIRKGDDVLNKEVLRVLDLMPRWQPGFQHGKFVKSISLLPFSFN
ncbi:hypothetical protein GCM10022393_35290 [Aquimarina addita]|uniref:TonB C-terminal domain-containing protein n=1 Tax=Aquimarina addita TaxID=870485 RepID=A0ABP6UQH7_9FLAO